MKIIRLKLSKPKASVTPRRWIGAALRTAQTLDTTLTSRRETARPEALKRPALGRGRYARSA